MRLRSAVPRSNVASAAQRGIERTGEIGTGCEAASHAKSPAPTRSIVGDVALAPNEESVAPGAQIDLAARAFG